MTIVSPSMTRVTFARTQRAKPEPPDSLHGVDGPGGCGGGGLEDWVRGFGRFLNTTAARTIRTLPARRGLRWFGPSCHLIRPSSAMAIPVEKGALRYRDPRHAITNEPVRAARSRFHRGR